MVNIDVNLYDYGVQIATENAVYSSGYEELPEDYRSLCDDSDDDVPFVDAVSMRVARLEGSFYVYTCQDSTEVPLINLPEFAVDEFSDDMLGKFSVTREFFDNVSPSAVVELKTRLRPTVAGHFGL